MKRTLILALLLAATGSAASAQVVINEAFENPPGGSDELWEFLEIYGPAGMPLDGYAIALLKGGTDTNGDDIPENPAEIDEAFTLDGLALGANGLLVRPGDVPSMAAAIGRLLDEPAMARALGARARQTIADRFSLDRMVAATESLYDRLLTSKHRTAAA